MIMIIVIIVIYPGMCHVSLKCTLVSCVSVHVSKIVKCVTTCYPGYVLPDDSMHIFTIDLLIAMSPTSLSLMLMLMLMLDLDFWT